MHVRRIVPSDVAEWMRMRDALWPGLTADAHRQEMAEYQSRSPSLEVFVVDRCDGRLGGFLEAGTLERATGCESRPVAYIEGWFIDPDLRESGWGGALVRAAEAWARSRGLLEIASDCLLGNEVSFLAHTALGFQEVERLIHFRKPLPRLLE